jgi:hypothetical protein
MSGRDRGPLRNRGDDTDAVPKWLQQALIMARPALHERAFQVMTREGPEGFQKACVEAGRVAFSMAKLRDARARVGFTPLPLTDYFESIAKGAGVILGPILARFSIASTSPRDEPSAAGWARLARVIGISLREALLHIRLSFAESVSPGASLALARQRHPGRPGRSRLADCEAMLEAEISKWGASDLHKLRTLEHAVRTAYGLTGS